MLANKVERAPTDLNRVGLDEEWELSFWCARFSVTPNELRACVLEAGPRTADVEKRLREAGHTAFRMGGED